MSVKPWTELFDEKHLGVFHIYNIRVRRDGYIGMKVSRADGQCFAFGQLDPDTLAQLLDGGRPIRAVYYVRHRLLPRLVFHRHERGFSKPQMVDLTLQQVVSRLKNKYFRIKRRTYPGCNEEKLYYGKAFTRSA
jgi:hypothetical protein